ncbi:MAG TPA: hypothetical protein VMT69_17665, partial [Kineosporiaceae bacterium]|nr:hypothetical protein [Kineosporiaceae bacterium]
MLGGLAGFWACRDATHSTPILFQSLSLPMDSIVVGTPGRPYPQRVLLYVLDVEGSRIGGAALQWTVTGSGARVEGASAYSDEDGACVATWVMGTDAAEEQDLEVRATAGGRTASVKLRAALVPSEVAALAVVPDTLSVKVGVATRVEVRALDRFGNIVPAPGAAFCSLDSLTSVDSTGVVSGRRRGWGRVAVRAQSVADTFPVHVVQIIQSITVERDTLRFSAIGAAQSVAVRLVDDQSQDVDDSLPAVWVADTTVAAVVAASPLVVTSRANGATTVRLSAGDVQHLVTVLVGQRVTSLVVSPDTATLRLGLADTLTVTATDSLGVVVAQPGIRFTALDSAVVSVDSTGVVRGRGRGEARIAVRAQLLVDTVRVHVTQVVQGIRVTSDTVRFTSLGAVQSVGVELTDDLGQVVVDSEPTAAVADTGVATLVPPGPLVLRSRANGSTRVELVSGTVQQQVTVVVAQRATRLALASDTLRFDALAESLKVAATAYDSLGSVVPGTLTGLVVADTSVAAALDDTTMRAKANGVTTASFSVSGLAGLVHLVVAQVPARITVGVTAPNPILTLAVGAQVPASCQALDRNGYALAAAPVVATSSVGAVAGTACTNLRVVRSGVDTLRVSLGPAQAVVPVAVAVPPVVWPPAAESLQVDSFPTVFTDTGPVPP